MAQSTQANRFEGSWWGATLVAGYAAVVCGSLVIAAVTRPDTDHGFIYELGRGCALAGLGVLTLQFVLTARLKPVERPFGLDLVLGFHRATAGLALLLIVAHPILLALGGAGPRLIFGRDVSWRITLGRIALLLLLLQVGTSIFRKHLPLGYERWRLLHNQAALIVGIAFLHAYATGGDFAAEAMRIFWWGMVAVAFVAYGYHKVVAPTVLARNAYRVAEVKQETHDVWTLKLEPPPGRIPFSFRPGQFQFLRLRRGRGLPPEEHPFTISSNPRRPHLTSTIKESGDFTATIGQTRVGDSAAVQGPFGRFSYTYHPDASDLVFIAGGIGITPFMSMLRHMRQTEADVKVLLLYANRSPRDIVFRDELADIAAGERPRLSVVHFVEETEEGWEGEKGRLDAEKVRRLIGGGFDHKMCYVCGPPPMMKAVIVGLRDIGVPPNRIEFERFAL